MISINKITRYLINFGQILVIGLLTSCLPNNSNHFKESMGIVSKQFEDSLFNHFPVKIDGSFRLKFISPEQCKEKGQCGVFLITNTSNEEINLQRAELINRGYLVGEFSDSLNFVENGTSNNELKSLEAIPIPSFSEILNNSELTVQQKKIDIAKLEVFLIDAKPGIFIKQEFLSNNPNLSSQWKNGYNKGIAINSEESEIIYWFQIW